MMYAQQTPQEVWRSPDFTAVRGSTKGESNSRPARQQQNNTNNINNNKTTAAAVVRMERRRSNHEEEEEEETGDVREVVDRYHSHAVASNECCSFVVQRIEAPVSVVWSMVRRFDAPQTYKHFVRSCLVRGDGDLKVGCLREVKVVSGLPAATSTERLEILDDERHIFSFRIVGGDHRLHNYRSTTTLHETLVRGKPGTVVVESYVVEVPDGNTKEDTCLFVDTIVKCNLQSLAQISQHLRTHRY